MAECMPKEKIEICRCPRCGKPVYEGFSVIIRSFIFLLISVDLFCDL